MSTDKTEDMSDTEPTDDAGDDAATDDAVDEAATEDSDVHDLAADVPEPVTELPDLEPPAPAPGPRRSIAGLVSIVLSVAALAAVAFLYLSRDPEAETDLDFARPADLALLRAQIDSLRDSLGALEGEVNGMASLGDESAEARRRLQDTIERELRRLDERLAGYDSLPPRVGNLENAVSAIQGIETGARDTLLLAEAEYYLQTANTLLTFAGNVELAKTALGMADDRLTSIGNPALANVRQAISDEVALLEGVPVVDIESNAILLSSLARLADSLPMRSIDGDATTTAGPETAEEPGAAGKAWSAIKEAVGDVVKVTPPGGEEAPLLLPGSEPLIRSNLSLQLQAARLALLTGEQAIFEQSLDDADAWLAQYFDGSSLQVQSARETVAEVRSVRLETELPDISESLRLLRQYESLSGSTP